MPPSAHHHTNCNYVLLLDDAVGINRLTSSVLSASSLHSAQEILPATLVFVIDSMNSTAGHKAESVFSFSSVILNLWVTPLSLHGPPSTLYEVFHGEGRGCFFTWEVCSDRGSGEKQPPSCAAILPSDDLHFLSLLKGSQINLAVVCLREHLTLTLCSAVACLICIRSPLLLSKGSPHRLSHPSLFTLNLRRR